MLMNDWNMDVWAAMSVILLASCVVVGDRDDGEGGSQGWLPPDQGKGGGLEAWANQVGRAHSNVSNILSALPPPPQVCLIPLFRLRVTVPGLLKTVVPNTLPRPHTGQGPGANGGGTILVHACSIGEVSVLPC